MYLPDYSRAKTISGSYTFEEDGWVTAAAANVTTEVKINGKAVAQGNWWNGSWSGNLNCQIMVSKGDVMTGAAGTINFIPFKSIDKILEEL